MKVYKGYLVGNPEITYHVHAENEVVARVLLARVLCGDKEYVKLQEVQYTVSQLLSDLRREQEQRRRL